MIDQHQEIQTKPELTISIVTGLTLKYVDEKIILE